MRRKNNKKRKFILRIVIVVFSISAVYFFFNQFGIIKYFDLKSKNEELYRNVESVDQHNELLRKQIDSLKNDDIKIEKVAREKFNMKRRGETVIKFEIQEEY